MSVSTRIAGVFRGRPALVRWLLLVPSSAWLVVFLVLPLVMVLRYSFAARGTYGGIVPAWMLENYRLALDPLYLGVYWRSVWMALATTVLCLAMSYPVAYYIAVRADKKWKNLLLVLAVVPFWTSFLIRTHAWIVLLRTEGVVNTWLLKLHVIDAPLPMLYTDFAVLIGLVYAELPFMILPLYANIERLDTRLLEAAADLGARPWKAFLRVTLPLTKVGILTGCVLVFIPSLGCFITSDLLGGAKTILVGNLIQNQFVQRNQPFGSAVSLLLTGVVLLLLVAGMRAGVDIKEEG